MERYNSNASSYHKKIGEFLYSILPQSAIEQEKIIYIEGITNIPEAKKLRADFFIKPINLVIEVDGEFHYNVIGRDEEALARFNRRKKLDNIKEMACEENGWEIIRIPYTDIKENFEEVKELLTYTIDNLFENRSDNNDNIGDRSRFNQNRVLDFGRKQWDNNSFWNNNSSKKTIGNKQSNFHNGFSQNNSKSLRRTKFGN